LTICIHSSAREGEKRGKNVQNVSLFPFHTFYPEERRKREKRKDEGRDDGVSVGNLSCPLSWPIYQKKVGRKKKRKERKKGCLYSKGGYDALHAPPHDSSPKKRKRREKGREEVTRRPMGLASRLLSWQKEKGRKKEARAEFERSWLRLQKKGKKRKREN